MRMIPNKIPAKVNFRFDKSGLSSSELFTQMAFCDRTSKSVFNSVALNVFISIVIFIKISSIKV